MNVLVSVAFGGVRHVRFHAVVDEAHLLGQAHQEIDVLQVWTSPLKKRGESERIVKRLDKLFQNLQCHDASRGDELVLREVEVAFPGLAVQGWAKKWAPGLVNFAPAITCHFCLNLPEK